MLHFGSRYCFDTRSQKRCVGRQACFKRSAMWRFKMLLALFICQGLLLTMLPTVVASTPPSNDNCVGAIPIDVGSIVDVNMTFATNDFNQKPRGPNNCSGTSVTLFGQDVGVWYSFQGTGGTVSPSTCLPGSSWKTSFSVYKGSCGNTTLQCVAGTRFIYDCPLVSEEVMFHTEVGTTYYMLVNGASGAFQLLISRIVRPPNDACSTAAPIVVGSSVVGDLSFATTDEEEVLNNNGCSGQYIHYVPGLWYTFQGTGGRVWPTTCFPESSRLVISVYKGSCGAKTLQCVTGGFSCLKEFTFNTDLGTTYYMLVRADFLFTTNPKFELLLNVPSFSSSVNSNDFCVNASPIAVGSTVTGNLTLATTDASEVPSDCLAGNPIGQRAGIWYSFDGTGDTLTVNTCKNGYTPGARSNHVSVYKGSCGATSLQCVEATYDSCTLPKFSFPTSVGTKYHMLVRSASDESTPTPREFDLTMYLSATVAPKAPPSPVAIAPKSSSPVVVSKAPSNAQPTPVAVAPKSSSPVLASKAPSNSQPVVAPKSSSPITTPLVAPTGVPPAPIPAPKSSPDPPMSPPIIVSPPVLRPVVAPVTPNFVPPRRCGFFGFGLFCPVRRCGLLGRLLGLCRTRQA